MWSRPCSPPPIRPGKPDTEGEGFPRKVPGKVNVPLLPISRARGLRRPHAAAAGPERIAVDRSRPRRPAADAHDGKGLRGGSGKILLHSRGESGAQLHAFRCRMDNWCRFRLRLRFLPRARETEGSPASNRPANGPFRVANRKLHRSLDKGANSYIIYWISVPG